jgi:integrase
MTSSARAGSLSGTARPSAVEYGPPDNLSHWHRYQWQGLEGFRAQPVQGADRPPRPYGSAHFRPGLAMDTNCSVDTREEKADNSPVVSGQNIVGKRRGGRSAPTTVNSSVRTREYLTTAEIERLMGAARKGSRYGHRDAAMILIAYRHGLRASELCDLQWSQVELTTGRLHVRRAKNGSPSVHPMQGDEIRALRRLQREQGVSSHVFMTERDGPMTPKAFHALFGRIGSRAKMQFPIHPHMLRHGCGYALANAGHDTRALQAWLGHKNIQHTVRYTELAPDRFKNFWR